jgi:hypothetical protein
VCGLVNTFEVRLHSPMYVMLHDVTSGFRLRQKAYQRRLSELVIAEWRETYRVRCQVKKRVIQLGQEAFRGWQVSLVMCFSVAHIFMCCQRKSVHHHLAV